MLHRYQCVSINNCHSVYYLLFQVSPRVASLVLYYLQFISMTCLRVSNKVNPIKFADDAKSFYTITTISNSSSLQEDITSLFGWSMNSDLNFNFKKFVQLSFKRNFNTAYFMDNTPIPQEESHKDLGLILSEDLSWNRYYNCSCLQNLGSYTPHFYFQPITSYTS